jgi:hypothetical protein
MALPGYILLRMPILITPVFHLTGFGQVVPEFLHIPSSGGTAVGAEFAV